MTSLELAHKARLLRRRAIEILFAAQSGHPGSSLSTMDFLVALFWGDLLKYDPQKPQAANRDFFLLSNGHACPALYVVLAEAGFFAPSELTGLRQLGAGAQGHPHRGSLPGIEISSGSLGQGLSVGIGLAYALKLKRKRNKVVVLMSDGEQEEGSTWEAIMCAPKYELNNLIAIVDKNQFQIDGATKDIMPHLDPLAKKYKAFGWQVQEIDGHNSEMIVTAFKKAKRARRPSVIISHTIRGKGVSFMEGSTHWHAGAISREQYDQAMKELA
jgi:transketolase